MLGHGIHQQQLVTQLVMNNRRFKTTIGIQSNSADDEERATYQTSIYKAHCRGASNVLGEQHSFQ